MRRAFTLIEVLVVVAILAIVAAILLPVFARSKAAAKKAVCISNLSQIGKSMLLYMADHDDFFPNGIDPVDKYRPQIWNGYPNWQSQIPYMEMLQDVLHPYLRSREVFRCPSDIGTECVDNHWPLDLPTTPSLFDMYGTSYFYRTEVVFRRISHSAMQWPSYTNVLFDASGHWHSGERMLRLTMGYREAWDLLRAYRYNVLYCDMHVKYVTYDALQRYWQAPL